MSTEQKTETVAQRIRRQEREKQEKRQKGRAESLKRLREMADNPQGIRGPSIFDKSRPRGR
jgi:hypothetical protein